MTIKKIVESKIPAQVMFYDGEGMCAGILYGEYIICGCCGSVFDVYDVVTMAQDKGIDAIRMFETWADISDKIKGDDMCAYNTITLENGGYM